MGERVAERLAALKAEGLSLQEIANRARPPVKYQVIQQLRDGDTRNTGLIVPIARALGCTAEWLWDEGGSDMPLDPDILPIIDRIKTMPAEKRRKVAELIEMIDPRPTDLASERKRRRRIS